MVREVLTQKILVRTADGEKKVPRIYALFLKRVDLALKGDARAAAEIFKLYGAAVPDVMTAEPDGGENELTRTDLEILEELRTLFGQDAI